MSTPQDLVDRALAASSELDAVFREASAIAVEMLGPAEMAEFRRLRRGWARFHADMGDFVDDNVPDVTVMSGGT